METNINKCCKEKLFIYFFLSGILGIIGLSWCFFDSPYIIRFSNMFNFIQFTTVSVLTYSVILSLLYYVQKKNKYCWFKFVFISSMGIFFCVGIVVGYMTHGESIRSVLFQDSYDVLMDFYNSIQYGMKPYENGVIYPPLINAFYGLLGRYMIIDSSTMALRYNQMGVLVYGMYCLFSYSLLGYFFFKNLEISTREKTILAILFLFSTPFLFLYDRANSIILVLICLLAFLHYYNQANIKNRYFSYIFLSLAVGIKITPAIFFLIILRDRRYKEFFHGIIICGITFFLPFIFTDGDIFILLNNISFASNLFQGVMSNEYGEYVATGYGVFVNTTSMFSMISRFIDCNLLNVADFINKTLMLSVIVISVINTSLERWKIYAIISSVIICCPSISIIYNLLYMLVPFVVFYNEKPILNKSNLVYLISFILIFILFVNIKLPIFNIFFNDIYVPRISTIIETIGVFIIVFGCCCEGWYRLYNEWICKLSMPKQYIVKSFVILCIISMMIFEFIPSSVNAYYPQNLNIINASTGFSLSNGIYSGIDNLASVKLKSTDIRNVGLSVNINNKNHDISEYCGEMIRIYIDDFIIREYEIKNTLGELIYISPEKLQNIGETFTISIERHKKKSEKLLPVSYIGPVKCYDALTSRYKKRKDAIEETPYYNISSGIYKEFGNNWMGRNAKILLDGKLADKGFIIHGSVPRELILTNVNKNILTVSINGECIKKQELNTEGEFYLAINRNEIPNYLKATPVIELELNCSNICDYDSLDMAHSMKEKSILLYGVGEVLDISNIEFSGKNFVFDNAGNDEDIVLHYIVPPSVKNKIDYIEFVLNGKVVTKQKVRNVEYPYLEYVIIPKNMLCDNINIIRYNCGDEKIQFIYVGEKNVTQEILSEEFSKLSQGIIYDKAENLWFTSYDSQMILYLPNSGDRLRIDYVVEPYMFYENNEPKLVNVEIDFNHILTIPINEAGEFFIDIPLKNIVNSSKSDAINLRFVTSYNYNQNRLGVNVMREKNNYRSIGIKRIKIY